MRKKREKREKERTTKHQHYIAGCVKVSVMYCMHSIISVPTNYCCLALSHVS